MWAVLVGLVLFAQCHTCTHTRRASEALERMATTLERIEQQLPERTPEYRIGPPAP